MAVLYRHIKPCGEIFYIGIGKESKRGYSKHGRNSLWRRTVKKYGYKVEVLFNDLTWKEACQIEKYLIKYYGRRDLGLGNLVNMTDGGEGCTNLSKEKRKGRKGIPQSQETKDILSEYNKINNIKPPSQKGNIQSEETINKRIQTIKERGHYNIRKVTCEITNKIWNSVRECTDENNIPYSSLVNKLNGHRINNTSFRYYTNDESGTTY